MGIDVAFLRSLSIEPLDRASHDRAAFSCGEPRIDNYLKFNAARNAAADHEKVYVAVAQGAANPPVLGYYVVCPHALDISSFPAEVQKQLPRRPTIGAIYVSIVGVDTSAQGRGLGTYLMADAFRRSAAAADAIGGHFIALDALNESAARLYRRLGFQDFPTRESPGRMLISMAAVRTAISMV